MKPAVKRIGGGICCGLFAALALFAAPPEASAQNVNFCSRTAEVVSQIRSKLSLGGSACSGNLGSITGEFLLRGLTSLESGDLDGLSGVTTLSIISSPNFASLGESPFDEMSSLNRLNMWSIALSSLPTGMFDNLTDMNYVQITGDSTPYRMDVKAELHGGRVRVRIDQATPLPVSVTWTASGGSTATGTATIAAGSRTSAVFGTVAANDATITLSNPTFTGVTESTNAFDGLVYTGANNAYYTGFQLGVSSTQPSATIPGLAPKATLVLSSASISENGGTATVTATLSEAALAQATITVSAAPVTSTGAMAGDFSLSANKMLTIATGQTTSTGTVTITAVDNSMDAANKSVSVSGTASGGNVQSPEDVTLTIADDEPPTVTLTLSNVSVSEGGGMATVTANLNSEANEPTTITVSVAPVTSTGAGVNDYRLSVNRTLTVAAGATASTGTVTITAINNDVRAAVDKQVMVSGTASGGDGAADPASVTLAITDNEPMLTQTTWSRFATNVFNIRITPSSVLGDTAAQPLSVTTNNLASWGSNSWQTWACVSRTVAQTTARVTGGPDTSVCTKLSEGAPPTRISLTQAMIDNDGVVLVVFRGSDEVYLYAKWIPVTYPRATLMLSSASISENGGVATVTAALSRALSEAVTVTVTATAGTGAVSEDFTQTGTTLTIAAGGTASAGTVTVTANDNDVDAAANKQVTVSATVSGGNGVANPESVTLAITDDDAAPGVVLSLSPSSISENGGVSTVTAKLSHPSDAATTVTVTAVSGFYTVGSDAVIVIAAGETANATDTATVAAVDNDTDAPDRAGTVTAAVSNDVGAGSVSGGALTVTDDDATPGVALSLSASSISENGGVSTVTAKLSHPSSAATTVTVTGVSGSYTVGRGVAGTIVIVAGQTTSADTATIAAVDNDVDAADNVVTVTGTAANDQATAESETMTVTGASLTITDDDDAGLDVGAATGQATEGGGTATFTVAALLTRPLAAVTVSVTSRDASEGSASPSSLTFETSDWDTGHGGDGDRGGRRHRRRGRDLGCAARIRRAATPTTTASRNVDVPVTTTDDDDAPGVVLTVSPSSISENGGEATVTATLSRASGGGDDGDGDGGCRGSTRRVRTRRS